jgi:hypothetical protein
MYKLNEEVVFNKKDLDIIINTTSAVGNEKISEILKNIDEESVKLVKIGYDFALKMMRSMVDSCINDTLNKTNTTQTAPDKVEAEELPPADFVPNIASDDVAETVEPEELNEKSPMEVDTSKCSQDASCCEECDAFAVGACDEHNTTESE